MSLFRARQAPERRDFISSHAIPPNSAGWANSSGVYVGTESALRLAAVYGCVSLISDTLSTTPIDVYRKATNGARVELDIPLLLSKPSGNTLPVEWLSALFTSALLRGNAYGYKDNFDRLGFPQEIHLIHPDEVAITDKRDGTLPVYRFGGEEVPRDRVFHLRGLTLPGATEGVSPVALAAQTIGMGLAAEDFGAKFFGEGAYPSAVLETDQFVNQVQAEEIKARLMSKLRGHREPIVLGAGTTWKPIQIPPNESMFLEASNASALDIAARIFKVPPSMIGLAVEGSSLTYSNREQDYINFQTLAVKPWASRFEQHISQLLPLGQYVKFNMDAGVRVDLTTRYQAHEIGIRAGFLKANEARELEDRPALPDGGDGVANARNLVEMVQKVYLGVGVVLTAEEARDLLNKAGAGLTGAPPVPPAPAAPTPPKEDTPDE